MVKVVELFGGTAPDIAGVQDKKALLAESIAESLLGLSDRLRGGEPEEEHVS